MTTSATEELYYDPWHADLNFDPYPMFKRFGIPEDYQHRVQEDGDRHVRTERGGQMTDNPDGTLSDGQVFADFIEWRVDHPADDLTTELLNAEFEDETGAVRKLRREELL